MDEKLNVAGSNNNINVAIPRCICPIIREVSALVTGDRFQPPSRLVYL